MFAALAELVAWGGRITLCGALEGAQILNDLFSNCSASERSNLL
jgi:hypothetical protein